MKPSKQSIPDKEDRVNTIFAGLFILLFLIVLDTFAVLIPSVIPTLRNFIKVSLVLEAIYALFTIITVVKAICYIVTQGLSPDELDNAAIYISHGR